MYFRPTGGTYASGHSVLSYSELANRGAVEIFQSVGAGGPTYEGYIVDSMPEALQQIRADLGKECCHFLNTKRNSPAAPDFPGIGRAKKD